MRKDRKHWKFLLAILIITSGESGRALSPDPALISLIPPSAQVVAGIHVAERSGSHPSLLLINRENEIDLNDFLAVFGVDPAIRWRQVILAGEVRDGKAVEHSVLASGQFNSSLIFKAATQNGATTDRYRGIAVLALQPFARDRADLRITRWLAILDSKLAVFGSMVMVQKELDRHLAGMVADSTLTERLSHLRKADDCWSAVEHFGSDERVKPALALLDPQLASSVHDGDEFVFGVHFGGQVEIEYEVFSLLPPLTPTASASSATRIPESFMERSDVKRQQGNGSAYVVMATSQERYDSWMSTVVAQAKLRRSRSQAAQ